MIVVYDNTDIAELVYQKLSGDTQVEFVTQADVEDDKEEEDEAVPTKGKRKAEAKWIALARRAQAGHGRTEPKYLRQGE